MNENNSLLIPEQYNTIWRLSWMPLCISYYSYNNKNKGIAIVNGLGACTSLLYWYYPNDSWRKYLDCTVIRLGFLYQLNKSIELKKNPNYLMISLSGAGIYLLGQYYYYKRMYWKYTYCHIATHISANLSSLCLIL